MRRKLAVLGILLLGTIFLVSTGLVEPQAQAVPICWQDSCQTTCTGPMGVECCCLYHCPSGNTWVCQEGAYCSNTDRSCIWG
jgi:hypothetical protein